MKLRRRQLFSLLLTTLFAATKAPTARAQPYPSRPVHWIVGYPAGGSADVVARLIGQYLSEQLRTPFVIENRPGAGNNIATEVVVRAPADGYTLLLVNPANAINATLYRQLDFNFLRDIVPVAGIMRVPNILEVNPAVPAKTLQQFIAYAKANPGKINMASGGNGAPSHLAGELFMMMTGIKMVHVPYRGAPPALIDLMRGRVQVMFDPLPTSISHIRAGSLRALAITTTTRSPLLPDVPTVAEVLPGYEASTWYGVGVPKNTPAAIIEKLNSVVNAALSDPKVKTRLEELGGTTLPGSAADFGNLIIEETAKWRKVIQTANVKLD